MKHLATAGRVIFGIPFIIFGLLHFMSGAKMAGLVPSLFPGPGAIWVYLAGLILLIGGVSIVANKHVMIGAKSIAGLMLIFVVTMHLPGLGNPETMQFAMMSLLKDTALLGGALAIAGMYGKHGCNCGNCANCRSERPDSGAATPSQKSS